MPRVLLVASTTGYQVRAFDAAATRHGVELSLATDRCHVLDDPWRDRSIPVRFRDIDASVRTVRAALRLSPVEGVLAVGDGPTVLAASIAEALSLRLSTVVAVRTAGNKLLTRIRFQDAGLPCPWFRTLPIAQVGSPAARVFAESLTYPCVVKPLALSGSRGVIRADSPRALTAAIDRVRQVVELADPQTFGGGERETILVEQYVPGREVAVEGVLTDGTFQAFAVFDKPDPLEGPFFEETIYVTPSRLDAADNREVIRSVVEAVGALGLRWGPVHAECRVATPGGGVGPKRGQSRGVVVLEVANRPIGGLCARALRFGQEGTEHRDSLEDVLLQHALGHPVLAYRREAMAAGVMMIPIATDGLYAGVQGLEAARAVEGVEDVVITAKSGQRVQPLPEGSSYLGFIFARGATPEDVVTALRVSHGRLQFHLTPVVALAPSRPPLTR